MNGEIDRIEELEEKLLWYGGSENEGKVITMHCYKDIASVSSEF